MKDDYDEFIAHRLSDFNLEPAHEAHITKLIKSYLDGYLDDEILEVWVNTLPKAAINFNHDMVDGYYTVKHDGNHDTFYELGDLRRYLRHHQLYPVWAGAEHYKPKDLDTFYTIVDVPESFKKEY